MPASSGLMPMPTSTLLRRQYLVGSLLLALVTADCITGNIHGMPVSFLLGIGSKEKEFDWIKPLLKPERLVYIGLRDVEAGEKKILRENNIKAFSMHEVDRYGIGKVVEMALDHINPSRDLPIHLSFDVDALDPSVAPSTGTPVCTSSPVHVSYHSSKLGARRSDLPRRSLHLRGRARDRIACSTRSGGLWFDIKSFSDNSVTIHA